MSSEKKDIQETLKEKEKPFCTLCAIQKYYTYDCN
jgi:hypothetical protein